MRATKNSCYRCGRGLKGKMAALSLVMLGLALVALFIIKNPIISVPLLVVSPLLLCPIICGAVGGLLWFVARPSKSTELAEK
jgi:hypothetical protein